VVLVYDWLINDTSLRLNESEVMTHGLMQGFMVFGYG
jgi:hypothetical protein